MQNPSYTNDQGQQVIQLQPVQVAYQAPALPQKTWEPTEKPPFYHIVCAVFSCLCCNCCCGLIAIVMSVLSFQKGNSGNYKGAWFWSKQSIILSLIGIALGLFTIMFLLIWWDAQRTMEYQSVNSNN